ncbi:MAG: SGNH/GDSL hydrolase family protein [Clostridia bacterium]|nr:SGNH/GDSL hydrolase family protein [Clostridia bacterium]
MTEQEYLKHFANGNFPVGKACPEDTVWHNARKAPFRIYGACDTGIPFRRIPLDKTEGLSSGGVILSSHTTGMRVRFVTDSAYVSVKAKEPYAGFSHNMTVAGYLGFDLYADQSHVKALVPPVGYHGFSDVLELSDTYISYAMMPKGLHTVTLFLPLYAEVWELEIGLSPNAVLQAPPPYTYENPIGFYGSSIVHGATASAPGNTYPAMISRMLDADILNLALSGHAFGEDAIAEYIASLSLSAFVYDYDHNAPTAEHLANTHERMFRIIRKAQPNLPIIMATRPSCSDSAERKARSSVVEATYRRAKEAGDSLVWYIPGETFFAPYGEENCVEDGTHPNDLGFYAMANAFLPILKAVLK